MKNKDKDLEKVLVNLPITDGEIFTHILTGQKPIERPIEMTYGEYKLLRNFGRVALTGMLITGAIMLYKPAIDNYGSLPKACDAVIQQLDKWPTNAWNP